MTPAQHRAEAERLLAEAEAVPNKRLPPEVDRLLATAQVHATLSLHRAPRIENSDRGWVKD